MRLKPPVSSTRKHPVMQSGQVFSNSLIKLSSCTGVNSFSSVSGVSSVSGLSSVCSVNNLSRLSSVNSLSNVCSVRTATDPHQWRNMPVLTMLSALWTVHYNQMKVKGYIKW